MHQRTFIAIVFLLLTAPAGGHTLFTVNPGGGADYTSLSAAEAGLPDPLTGDYEISCSGSTDDTTSATVNVDTNGYNLYLHGDNTSGVFDEAKYQMKPGAYATAITIASPAANVIVEGIQFTGISTSYSAVYVTDATGSIVIRKCLFQDFTQSAYGHAIYFYGTGTSYTGRIAYNNIAWNCAIPYVVWQCQGTFYNNTANASTEYGLYITQNACNALLKNNLIKGSTTADYYVNNNGAGTITTAKNYTSDATSPDAGCGSATITFVGGEDFHLDSSMSGTLLGEDLSGTFTTDIDGDTRSSWYAGADELTGGGAAKGAIAQRRHKQ